VQVKEGLAVAVAVEESAAPSPLATAAIVGRGAGGHGDDRPQAALEPQAGTDSGGDDLVMVPVDQGAPLPPPTGERDAAVPVAPKASVARTAPSIGGAEDMSMSRYLTILGIGIIDLDATKLPSNDREILKAVTDRVFADPSLLDAIVSGPPAPHQDGDAGGSTSFASPEAAEGVLGESAADTKSTAIAPPAPDLRRDRGRGPAPDYRGGHDRASTLDGSGGRGSCRGGGAIVHPVRRHRRGRGSCA
jgi:hypothetical protein